MLDLNAWRDAYTAALRAGLGETLPVVDDPAEVNPPCVLVGGPELGPPSLAGCTAEVTLEVYLLAAPPGDGRAMRWLLATLPPLLELLAPESATRGTFDNRLPCYVLTVAGYLE